MSSHHPPLSWMASLRWPIITRTLDAVPRTAAVLEAGCGQGAVASRLAERFATYVGLEPDEQSAAVAAGRAARYGGVVVPSLADVPGDLRFGLVCAFEVLEHIEDDVAALREWLTRAEPGALFCASVPADPERFSLTDEHVGHFRRYTDDSLGRLLRSAGLTQVRLRRYGYPLGFALEDARNLLVTRRTHGTVTGTKEERSGHSGRMLQPRRPWEGAVRAVATRPFVAVQDRFPTRGPGLVATGRVPMAEAAG